MAWHGRDLPPLLVSALTRGGITTAVGVLGTDDVIRTPAGCGATSR